MQSDRPLRIRVSALHPRVLYTCKMVFDRFLQVPAACVVDTDDFDLYYRQLADGSAPSISCDGFLYGQPTDHAVSDDPLSKVFRRIAQVDAYEHPVLDAHHRHVEHAPGLELHFDLAKLRNWLRTHFPSLTIPEPRFTWEVTIDIDQPWKHQQKPLHVRAGGFLRDLVQGKTEGLKERLQPIDPFDTLSVVRQICPPEKTTAFILSDGTHPHDSRFNLGMQAFQAYVKRWQEAGFSIGIHPSYLSSEQQNILNGEIDLLRSVIGPVHKSRQHYLRYRLPDTFRQLIARGIRQDYSLCPHEGLGGRTGIAHPYTWYDFPAERETELELIPAVVMDRSLQQYLKLNPAAAFGQTCAVIDTLRAQGGHFVLILHNETFSESGEWKGWLRWIQSTLSYLQAHGS